ncbi:MAG TPA: PadR family transcriptional regulator [Candidatus Limnocylindrales bacterium]|nr:PadR family transcriptional regulator [Candidatus Limnocylindrales bacterium]
MGLSLNISYDISCDIGIDMFDEHSNHHNHQAKHLHNWLRRIDMVPKGFLRYHVLEALSEKPMSGSELMEQIQEHSGGRWKPSPGSIYPLLAFLEDSAYIKELPKENGVKRYEMTENGRLLLEKNRQKLREDMGRVREHMSIFQTSVENLRAGMPHQKNEVIQAMIRLQHEVVRLSGGLHQNYSQQVESEGLTILNEAITKLENLNKKLQESKGQDNEATF